MLGRKPTCACGTCLLCRRRKTSAEHYRREHPERVKPGPPRICDCGECAVCKRRANAAEYYRRNHKTINAKKARERRKRLGQPEVSPMDAKALEWLREIRGT